MRPGLAVKLAVLLAAIGILASGLTGFFAYTANRSMLVEAAQRNLLTSTQLLNRRFAAALTDIGDDSRLLASLPIAPRLAAAGSGKERQREENMLAQAFAAMMKIHPAYLQIRLIGAGQNGLERVRVDSSASRPIRVEGEQLQEKGHFPYVFETLRLGPGRTYQSRISINRENGTHSAQDKPILRVATPVYEARGPALGVLVITVDLASLLTTLKADLPKNYGLYLANKWGDFLIHPNPALTFGFDKGRRFFMQDSFRATRPLFDKGARSTVLNGLDEPQQAAGLVLAFEREPFSSSDPHHFVVLGLSQPLTGVLDGAESLGRSIVRMVLAFSALAIVLAVVFARAITHPLNMLAHAATRFSSERAMEALPLKRMDEIGILARCFDRMRNQIQSHMAELLEHQQEMAYLAHHDQLSGLPNRTLFFRQLEESLHSASRRQSLLAVLFVDLDCFKQVNDEFGHAMGDQVLHTVARRLQHTVRAQDLVARLGGDEFIILLGDVSDDKDLPAIANKILDSLREPMMLGGRSLSIGGSIGISVFPRDGCTAEELVQHADQAMYEVKTSGRNATRLYSPPEQRTGLPG
ncbi:diguanylate cyclase domain-containing protein [Paludibacterium yongneupense]|uniref:diguanylate cyclase domain-containing protein n=1 Tax=Paludibacterium yongneupense TaxID=400061 RepID=UPI0004023226|nr:diguanylate cyclase [Paludibacterium yongneupense]